MPPAGAPQGTHLRRLVLASSLELGTTAWLAERTLQTLAEHGGHHQRTLEEATRTKMAMDFEELDGKTRQYMLMEFEAEMASDHPYIGSGLSVAGRAAFPDLMRVAIKEGSEVTLGD